MAAQRANLSVRQSGIGCIRMATMPEAREGYFGSQPSGVSNLSDNTLDVPDRIARRSRPRQVHSFFVISIVTHYQQCAQAGLTIKSRHEIGPEMTAVLVVKRYID
jgi:hypothetical protein